MNLENIYQYSDYRIFLSDYFSTMKEKKSHFSFRYFAQKAGFKSPNFCYYLINGSRNVSEKSVDKLVKGIGLKGKSAKYFYSMVKYTQSSSKDEREEEFANMEHIRRSTTFYKVDVKAYKYLEEWYIPVVRELVVKKNWETFKDIADIIVPHITEKMVEKSVSVLLENKLIKKDDEGFYTLVNDAVSTAVIPHYLLKNIKKQHVYNSIDVMDLLPKEERYLTGSTLMLDDETYKKSLEIIEKAHQDIVKLAVEEMGDRVFQLNFQLYPNSIKREEKQ